jgi:hypothetical protein
MNLVLAMVSPLTPATLAVSLRVSTGEIGFDDIVEPDFAAMLFLSPPAKL